MITILRNSLALSLLLLAFHTSLALAAKGRIDVGVNAPALSGADIAGRQQDLAGLRGNWVYIDYWATWCGPCMLDLPKVVAMSKAMQERPDFKVLSVSLDEEPSREMVKWATNEYGIGYPVLFDGQGWNSPLVKAWGITQIPSTFLINPQGAIVARDLPASDVAKMIGSPKAQPYRPMNIATSEEVLPDSPSTGRGSLRDVRITLNLDPALNATSRFHLYLTCGSVQPQGQPGKHDMRYEITIKPSAANGRSEVEINRAVGVSYLSDVFAQINTAELPAPQPKDAPDVSVEFDEVNKLCVFVVPLPATCPLLTYALSMFDERLGQYVNNGLVAVKLAGK
jgi:thiol-disulfide isomerase/thioredoxin